MLPVVPLSEDLLSDDSLSDVPLSEALLPDVLLQQADDLLRPGPVCADVLRSEALLCAGPVCTGLCSGPVCASLCADVCPDLLRSEAVLLQQVLLLLLLQEDELLQHGLRHRLRWRGCGSRRWHAGPERSDRPG